MRTKIYWIPGPWAGQLGIAPRPRGGDWLDGEIDAWKACGVHTVVSLLTSDEAAELLLDREEWTCRTHGMSFRSFPMPDGGLPPSRPALESLASDLLQELQSGRCVVLHCRQGIGRSSVTAASILTQAGISPLKALASIEAARGRPVPDTGEQRKWVQGLTVKSA